MNKERLIEEKPQKSCGKSDCVLSKKYESEIETLKFIIRLSKQEELILEEKLDNIKSKWWYKLFN